MSDPLKMAPQSDQHDNETLKKPSTYSDRIVLTTYPGQLGMKPIPIHWGKAEVRERGPILASRNPQNIKHRNAIGAYSGSYCIYHALAVAIGDLDSSHKPDFTNTEPAVQIGPFDSWKNPDKIVSFDPFGHIAQTAFRDEINEGLDIRPTIAVTQAHMRVPEIQSLVHENKVKVDKKIVLNQEGELSVVKAAVEPVWYLPGVAKRFGIEESELRRALFEDTGGMYPELVTRSDIKVFLPPIGGLTVYIFGNVHDIADPHKKLTVRVHDECNGSDVFGSDICTCRPYLTYGIEQCIKQAQDGGVGLIIYFRKEGRALGEVTKYLVYNARKRQEGGDKAATYFLRTENIAGVKDMRFQALMPDILHWFGIKKIDRFISMSNMKYDAITQSGIEIVERVDLPESMLPPDSKVEIDAKIASGYFSSRAIPTSKDLEDTKGRSWDDLVH